MGSILGVKRRVFNYAISLFRPKNLKHLCCYFCYDKIVFITV
jgi:hypothetical protein